MPMPATSRQLSTLIAATALCLGVVVAGGCEEETKVAGKRGVGVGQGNAPAAKPPSGRNEAVYLLINGKGTPPKRENLNIRDTDLFMMSSIFMISHLFGAVVPLEVSVAHFW